MQAIGMFILNVMGAAFIIGFISLFSNSLIWLFLIL